MFIHIYHLSLYENYSQQGQEGGLEVRKDMNIRRFEVVLLYIPFMSNNSRNDNV